LAIRAHLSRVATCAGFVGGHELSRTTLGAKGRALDRGFFFVTRFACGLFGLVGVVAYWAFRAVRLPLFRLIQSSVAGQTKRRTVFRLIFSTAAIVALVLTRLYLVPSTLAGHAIGFAGGFIFNGLFAGRTSVAKGGASVAVCVAGALEAIFNVIVVSDIYTLDRFPVRIEIAW